MGLGSASLALPARAAETSRPHAGLAIPAPISNSRLASSPAQLLPGSLSKPGPRSFCPKELLTCFGRPESQWPETRECQQIGSQCTVLSLWRDSLDRRSSWPPRLQQQTVLACTLDSHKANTGFQEVLRPNLHLRRPSLCTPWKWPIRQIFPP